MPLNVLQPDAWNTDHDLPRIAWTPESTDLHVNLVSLRAGEEIGAHVNHALDVVLTCLAGRGTLDVEGESVPLRPGTVAVIPKGASRRVVAGDNVLRFTTCHGKRGGLVPSVRRNDVSSRSDISTPSRTGDRVQS